MRPRVCTMAAILDSVPWAQPPSQWQSDKMMKSPQVDTILQVFTKIMKSFYWDIWFLTKNSALITRVLHQKICRTCENGNILEQNWKRSCRRFSIFSKFVAKIYLFLTQLSRWRLDHHHLKPAIPTVDNYWSMKKYLLVKVVNSKFWMLQ